MTPRTYRKQLKAWLSYGRVLPTFIKDYVEELEKKIEKLPKEVVNKNKILQK